MKKILITILFMLAAIGAYGQNKFKYPIQALGGLSIGNTADTAKIDSVIYSLGTLKFYRGSTEISVGGGSMTYPAAGIALSTGAAWGASITNNSTNWNTAYTDRLKWDGGNGDLVAATGRSSLGGTTVGQAFFTLTNPTAITFPRINADNTVTALSAANFKTALSLTSADVGLGNVTNKAQVEVEDSAAMLTPYIRAAEVSAAYSNKALSNLASVAINTHLLPATDGAVNLGSATYKWGNIFLDSAKVINWNNGDITETHSDGTLTFAGGNIVLPSTTSIGDVSATEISYVNNVTSAIQTQLNNKADTAGAIDLEEFLLFDASTDTLATKEYARGYGGTSATGGTSNSVFVQLSDTVPIAVFSAGAGNAADTSYFSTSTIYGAFYNKGSDTIKVTEVRAAMIGEAGDTLGLQIYWNDTLNKALGDSYVKLNTDPLPVGRPNGLTTGTVDVSFAASDIPPNVWVWAKTPTVLVKKKPSMLTVTLSGYKVPSYIDRFSNVRMLSDTIVLATFGAGGGNATDTLSFTTSTKYGAFFNAGSDTLNITELRAVMGHGIGTDTLNIQVQWHATLGSGSATKLNTTDLPILSTTTGTTDTSFDNAKIPPNVWVWATTPYVPADALKRKPTFLLIQLTGYKIPKY